MDRYVPSVDEFEAAFPPDPRTDGAVRRLQNLVRRYHDTSVLDSRFLPGRLYLLEQIETCLERLQRQSVTLARVRQISAQARRGSLRMPPQHPQVSAQARRGSLRMPPQHPQVAPQAAPTQAIIDLAEKVRKRKAYLQALNRLLGPGRRGNKQARITEVVNLFSQQGRIEPRVERHKPGFGLHTTMHESRILEKYSPGRIMELGGVRLSDLFHAFVLGRLGQGQNPGNTLVDFFLDLENYREYRPVLEQRGSATYFSKERAPWALLHFVNGKALLAYVKEVKNVQGRAENANVPYDPNNPDHRDLVPELRPFQTITGPSPSASDEVYASPGGRDPGAVDFWYCYLYVLRKGDLYTYPEAKGFHSAGFRGKSVQAAGTVVSLDGKIMAIDNASGHYMPGHHHLAEAVRYIQLRGAFAEGAMVGLLNHPRPNSGRGLSRALFSVEQFNLLMVRSFHVSALEEVFQQLEQQYPEGPKQFPHAEREVYCGFEFSRWGQPSNWHQKMADFIDYHHREGPSAGYWHYVDALVDNLDNSAVPRRADFRSNTSMGVFQSRYAGLNLIDDALEDYQRLRRELVGRKDRGRIIAYDPSVRAYLASLRRIETATGAWLNTFFREHQDVDPRTLDQRVRRIRDQVADLNSTANREYLTIRNTIKPSWGFN